MLSSRAIYGAFRSLIKVGFCYHLRTKRSQYWFWRFSGPFDILPILRDASATAAFTNNERLFRFCLMRFYRIFILMSARRLSMRACHMSCMRGASAYINEPVYFSPLVVRIRYGLALRRRCIGLYHAMSVIIGITADLSILPMPCIFSFCSDVIAQCLAYDICRFFTRTDDNLSASCFHLRRRIGSISAGQAVTGSFFSLERFHCSGGQVHFWWRSWGWYSQLSVAHVDNTASGMISYEGSHRDTSTTSFHQSYFRPTAPQEAWPGQLLDTAISSSSRHTLRYIKAWWIRSFSRVYRAIAFHISTIYTKLYRELMSD